MKRIAVIGAGISGMTVARFLSKDNHVVVYEKESVPGGLVRCEKLSNGLFHLCGGHVFNSKNKDVLDWFWNCFAKETEFHMMERNSVVCFNDFEIIPYPIENHVYLLEEQTQKNIVSDWIGMCNSDEKSAPVNFQDFLVARFGETLYGLYFKNYNEKVWRRDLSSVPLSWLDGKLPMPSVEEMIFNNMNHVKEKAFVHSSFWYENNNGSQFIADRLSEGLDIRYDVMVERINYSDSKWYVCDEEYDNVVFCGNVKQLGNVMDGYDLRGFASELANLEFHGTTAAFCEIDKNPFSWIYLPDNKYKAHRIICTGNFSVSNNHNVRPGRITASVEFTDEVSMDEIKEELSKMPFHPEYVTHHYSKYTYPIQSKGTRELISNLKKELKTIGFYLTGRFADWEYYNMDVAIGAAMATCKSMDC